MRLYHALRNVSQFRTVFDFGEREVAHWFPGHMAKGLKQMRASLKNVDCIETLDVRPHLLILNKMDLADLSNQQTITKKLEKKGVRNVLFTNCLKQSDDNIKKLVPLVVEIIESKPRFHRDENTNFCLMVIGVPNVGKSSLINSLRRTNLKKGTILDHLVGEDIIADYLLYSLNRLGKFSYVEKYDLQEPSDDIQHVLKRIAVKLGKTQRVKAITGVGNITITVPNYTAAAYDFIRTFRKGELGQVMLD
ncbi:Mitochondrial ribosome-associated GTPase 1 [Liparis tanakae]|uniref:Mitochondrial ribosome-associated GTPase 1 n=1 Tax=Liparis tanakae TaxID=230148 RepID=A0A4Z2GXL7_9TELE|nr:Mitochondrial ribosome-associated GTPase 1 [Liparis tanakae]